MLERGNKTGRDQLELRRVKAEQFLERHTTVSDCLAVVSNSKEVKLTRAFALIAAAAYSSVGYAKFRSTIERKHDFSKIPLNPNFYTIEEKRFSAGYWSEVFKAVPRTGESVPPMLPTLVYKCEYPVAHAEEGELERVIENHKKDYEELRRAYAIIPDFIPGTHYRIEPSPRTGIPAVAMIQSYVGDDTFDLFDSPSRDKVRALLSSNEEFKQMFEDFRAVTLELHKELKAPDIAGSSNVLVAKVGDNKYRLRLVDQHRLHPNNRIAQKSQQKAIQYLQSL